MSWVVLILYDRIFVKKMDEKFLQVKIGRLFSIIFQHAWRRNYNLQCLKFWNDSENALKAADLLLIPKATNTKLINIF
jgi:hypothetical protein